MSNRMILASFDPEEWAQKVAELILSALNENTQHKPVDSDPDEQLFLKPTSAGKMIDHGPDFIRKLVKQGHLNAYYPGADLTVSREELLNYMELKKVERPMRLKKIS